MKIFLAADHAGFELKEQIKIHLANKGYLVEDCGAYELVKTDDYPDLIKKAAFKASKESGSFGVIFGKSGAGETMVANKIIGIRAVTGFNKQNVKLAREHNDANVLSLGSEFISFKQAVELIDIFLNTPFLSEERHARRIRKMSQIEREK